MCGLSALTSFIIWSRNNEGDGHHPAIACTLSCLSTKMSIHHQPPDRLPQCVVDTTERLTLLRERDDDGANSLPVRVTSEGERECHHLGVEMTTCMPADDARFRDEVHGSTGSTLQIVSGHRHLTTIPASTEIALCDFIAATNIASIYGHSAWQCTSARSVVTQPCNGGTAVWPSISGCSSSGDVTRINLMSRGISGK